jgi:hypothetical protein
VPVNTSLRPFSPFYRRLRPNSYPDLLRPALFDRDVEQQERLTLRLSSRGGDAQCRRAAE